MISDNLARLKLQRHMKRLPPTFNIDLLSNYHPSISDFPGRPSRKASPIILEDGTGEKFHIIERLHECRQRNHQMEWLVE